MIPYLPGKSQPPGQKELAFLSKRPIIPTKLA
jgi:hypothetical protein